MTTLPPGGARAQQAVPGVPRSGGLLRHLYPGSPSRGRLAAGGQREGRRPLASTRTHEDRAAVAGTCVRNLGIEFPALIDETDDRVERAYTGWPDRLYVIDEDGSIAYKSAAGPFGFKPEQVQAALERLFPAAAVVETQD